MGVGRHQLIGIGIRLTISIPWLASASYFISLMDTKRSIRLAKPMQNVGHQLLEAAS